MEKEDSDVDEVEEEVGEYPGVVVSQPEQSGSARIRSAEPVSRTTEKEVAGVPTSISPYHSLQWRKREGGGKQGRVSLLLHAAAGAHAPPLNVLVCAVHPPQCEESRVNVDAERSAATPWQPTARRSSNERDNGERRMKKERVDARVLVAGHVDAVAPLPQPLLVRCREVVVIRSDAAVFVFEVLSLASVGSEGASLCWCVGIGTADKGDGEDGGGGGGGGG